MLFFHSFHIIQNYCVVHHWKHKSVFPVEEPFYLSSGGCWVSGVCWVLWWLPSKSMRMLDPISYPMIVMIVENQSFVVCSLRRSHEMKGVSVGLWGSVAVQTNGESRDFEPNCWAWFGEEKPLSVWSL